MDLATKLIDCEDDNLALKITNILKGEKRGGNILTGCTPPDKKERSLKQILILLIFLVFINMLKVMGIYMIVD